MGMVCGRSLGRWGCAYQIEFVDDRDRIRPCVHSYVWVNFHRSLDEPGYIRSTPSIFKGLAVGGKNHELLVAVPHAGS